MTRVFPIIRRVVVQGGDVPPGAAVMSDKVSLFAVVNLPDAIAGKTDAITFNLNARYADQQAGTDDTLTVKVGLADTQAGRSETLTVQVVGQDLNAAQSEALQLALTGYAEQIATALEAATVRPSGPGLSETAPAPSEARTSAVTTWGSATTTAGTAPTNPGSATGPNDGAVSTVKAGGLANGTSTLTVSVPRANVPASGTKAIVAWYSTTAGTADTFTLTYTATGGNPASLTLPAGNFLTTPYTAAITTVGAASDPSFAFTHAAPVPATGGSISVDAVGIRTTNAL